jgi:spore maturation protein CgeB/SAM-dependent methyltransferase
MTLRILTFNWHESYIHLLAKTGHAFDVVEKEKAGIHGWIHAIRPVPPNCRLVSEVEAEEGLRSGAYDRILAQNLGDLLFVRPWPLPKVLVFHSKLTNDLAITPRQIDRAAYLGRVKQLVAETKNLTLVFISESKKADWGLEGEVVLPGIDAEDYQGYVGDLKKVVRIGNFLKERDVILGYSLQERILGHRPSTILGLHNPQTPNAYMPRDWDEYRDLLRRHRVYLHTTQAAYEDGYNLAMLECMATGMPVVSTNHAASPIQDGVNGFLTSDEKELRERIDAFLEHHERAVSMGSRAREAVLDLFPIKRFLTRWKGILEGTPARGRKATKAGSEKMNILMSYASHPATTGTYLEKALRKRHRVITMGPAIDEEIVEAWDLDSIRNRVKAHDIPYFSKDLAEVLPILPAGWVPDLFLWVESGVTYELEGLGSLPCPSACYLVDTHLRLEKHLETAKDFDVVFVAQKKYLRRFKEAGIERVHWLPLACDPDVHRKCAIEKEFDVSFVGSITPRHRRRNALLVGLAERFDLHVERCFLDEMARVFSRSKIVFNRSIRDDLNMRVFEAMATGSLLVTDEATGSGLTEVFEEGKHLIVYRTREELCEQIRTYLANDEAREKIAAEGMREVLRRHTYDHRARKLVRKVLEQRGRPVVDAGAGIASSVDHAPARVAPKRGTRGGKGESMLIESGNAGRSGDAHASAYYTKERPEIADLIPGDAQRILDVGCGGGRLARLLKQGAGHREVWGVEMDSAACTEAKKWLDRVDRADASVWEPPADKGYFDALVFADVLEHLPSPQATVERYLSWLKPGGAVVLSLPNVRFWGVVKHLVDGYWTYQDEGILDRTHLRFFTWTEVQRLLAACGLEVERVRWNQDRQCPEVPAGETRDLELGRITIHDLTPEELREFFVFQYLVRAVRTEASLRREAERLEGSGEYASAFEVYASLAERAGTDAGPVLKMGETCRSEEERRRFRKLLEERLSLQPANVDLLVASARMHLEENRFEVARDRLERVVLFNPEHAEARTQLRSLSAA